MPGKAACPGQRENTAPRQRSFGDHGVESVRLSPGDPSFALCDELLYLLLGAQRFGAAIIALSNSAEAGLPSRTASAAEGRTLQPACNLAETRELASKLE